MNRISTTLHIFFQSRKQLIILLLAFSFTLIILGNLQSARANVPPAGGFCTMLRTTLRTTVGCRAVSSGIDSSIVKFPARPDLVGVNTSTLVTMRFVVTGEPGVPITNTIIRERLAPNFTFANPADIKLNGNPLNPSPDPSGSSSSDINLGTLQAGTYTLTFNVTINPGAPEGTYAIEQAGSNCADPNARIDYIDGLNRPGCVNLPGGSIFRRFPKIIFNSDAWIGNKPLQASNTIKIGPNTLIVSGKGTSQGISNYNLPTTGKNAWNSVETLMRQRVERAVTTRSAEIVASNRCPSGDVRTVYLNAAGNSPFVDGTRITRPKIWILNNCSFTLRDATFQGTGTIVNVTIDSSGRITYNGGVLNVFGGLRPSNPTDTFGYITFRENAGSSGIGHINLQGDADPDNVAIFTSGVVDMGGNSTGTVITRLMQVISRFIQFPPQNQMNDDIIFERPTQLVRNVPPLFQQFSQPTGQEVP